MVIQSILLNKMFYTKSQAINWLKVHDFRPMKLHETEHFYRFRMRNPIPGSRYRNKTIAQGVEFVLMF